MTCWVLALNFGRNKVQVEGMAWGWGGCNIRKGQIKVPPVVTKHVGWEGGDTSRVWARLVPHSLDSSHLRLTPASSSFPASFQECVSTWQPSLHGAHEPRMPDPLRYLQDLACEPKHHSMFIKVGKKEAGRVEAWGRSRDAHTEATALPWRGADVSSVVLSFPGGDWDLGGPLLTSPRVQGGGVWLELEVGGGPELFLARFSPAWGPEDTMRCLHSLPGIDWGSSSLIAKPPRIGPGNLHLEGHPRWPQPIPCLTPTCRLRAAF